MLKSLSLVFIISILIHCGISYFNHLDNKNVAAKIDLVGDSERYQLGYNEGYHRATEDLAELNSTPEIH